MSKHFSTSERQVRAGLADLAVLSEAGPARLEITRAYEWIVLGAIPDALTLLDGDGTILFSNSVADAAFGEGSNLIGRSWFGNLDRKSGELAERALAEAQRGKISRFSLERDAAGSLVIWDISFNPVGTPHDQCDIVVAIARDVTREKAIEEQVRQAANHDELTKLPNRALFQEKLELLTRRGEGTTSFGLLFLDVDNFKQINDTLGHDTGDELLRTIGQRLHSATKEADLVARLGGDEFAILLSDVAQKEDLDLRISTILDALKNPCVHDGKVLDCGVSIGASLFPIMGRDKSELMKNADVALYEAKRAGRGTRRIFEPGMRSNLQKRASMLSLARHALERQSIVPFYQPKIDLRTGTLAGFEALLRWHDNDGKIQHPDTISAAFRDPVLAAEISDLIVDIVIHDVSGWTKNGVKFEHVAVNAGAAEFRKGNFAGQLLTQLAAARVPTSSFQIEVTETVFLGRGAEYVEQALKLLSTAGVAIALDDFGTGFASLSHLKQFPVNFIKIDQSFIRDLHEDADDEAIVRAVIALSKSLGIKVVAEGIETPAQSAYLRKYDCDYGQGYLFSPALPAEAIPDLVQKLAARAERLRSTSALTSGIAN